MTVYRVVLREQQRITIRQFRSIQDAGDHIFYERAFARWTVKAADTETGPSRDLRKQERLKLERILYPSLFE